MSIQCKLTRMLQYARRNYFTPLASKCSSQQYKILSGYASLYKPFNTQFAAILPTIIEFTCASKKKNYKKIYTFVRIIFFSSI